MALAVDRCANTTVDIVEKMQGYQVRSRSKEEEQ
jgi:hypothetical protein